MSGHKQLVELCPNDCVTPLHVDVCGLPEAVNCQQAAGYTAASVSTSTHGGFGATYTVEESGPSPTILYSFAVPTDAETFEDILNLAVVEANTPGQVASIDLGPNSLPAAIPSLGWNSAGISVERVTTTSVRVRWRVVAYAEPWAASILTASNQSAWTTSLPAEGVVTAWPVSSITRVVWVPTYSTVSTLPVSVPCGVAINNADELAAAIAGRIFPSTGSGASGPDTEIIERLVCAAGVTLVQRTVYTNGVAGTPTYFGTNGASVAAPAAYTEGPCDDQDIDIETELVCAAGVTLARRRIVDAETGALVSEQFIGANGTVVAAPATYTQGACSLSGTTSTLTSTRNIFAANAAVTVAATAVPVNARAVTVYNDTRAAVTFTVSGGAPGTHQIPPYTAHNITLPDTSVPFSGTWTVAAAQGNAGPLLQANTINPSISVDWVTRTP